MAYNAVAVTLGPTKNVSAHKASAAGSSQAGDVYLAWNTSTVTNLTDLRLGVLRALELAAGSVKDS